MPWRAAVKRRVLHALGVALLDGERHRTQRGQHRPRPLAIGAEPSRTRPAACQDAAAAGGVCHVTPANEAQLEAGPDASTTAMSVVLCGTFRRRRQDLLADYEALVVAGCRVLSPADVDFVHERDGFVFAAEEIDDAPTLIEERHLEAMIAADFIWLHAPDGYVGPTAAMELGFARAHGLTVFSRAIPRDPAFGRLVTVVDSPAFAIDGAHARTHDAPADGLVGLQMYYHRVAKARGYDLESPQDCMLLLTEEVGELARAVRKRVGLAREGGYERHGGMADELADVQLYILHLANVMDVDLAEAVIAKERTNVQRHMERGLARAA